MTDERALLTVTDTSRLHVSTVVQLADIPEEEILLQTKKALVPGEPAGLTLNTL
jgi:hypothetical protein